MNEVDLTNCDREPIHIPGSIQTHGALIACDRMVGHVSRYSENLQSILHIDVGRTLIGEPLTEIVGAENVHQFRNALASSMTTGRPALIFGVAINDGLFDVSIHLSGSESVLEFEPRTDARRQQIDVIRNLITRIGQPDSFEKLAHTGARLIRATLGYDRVMIYQFEEDGSGQVIAESKAGHLESFMGQYFPASDIPQQARQLYLKSTIRIISNADDHRIPILGLAEQEPLDLSHAHLRSVSSIHCEYLRNMGVGASMSISIIIDGTLWGLVACHHYEPKYLDMAERAAIEMFGEVFSLQVDLLRQKRRLKTSKATRGSLDRLLQQAPLHAEIFDLLDMYLPDFAAMVPSDGVVLWMNGRMNCHGHCPTAAETLAIVEKLGPLAGIRVWSSHSMSEDIGAFVGSRFAGVLLIPLSQRPRDYLIFFRQEFEHTLNWAGNPNKAYSTGPLGDRLTPRKSFALWKENVRGQSRRWSQTDLEVAEGIRSALVEIVLRHNEIMAEERGRADLRQRMLNEELNHRVKNILAVIKSLIGQGSESASSIQDYLATLSGRIEALSVAHDQIVRGDGGGLISNLLAAELRPYAGLDAKVALTGPPVWVDTSSYSVLALVFHELATNAAKYGALSAEAGQLAVRWRLNAAGDCEVSWIESGGPLVQPPTRKGFGSVLTGRSIPHELGGEADLDYAPEGLRARFVIPAHHVAQALDDAGDDVTLLATASEARSLSNPADVSVLLVEDQMLIAMDAEMMLSSHGLRDVRTASSVREALSVLETFTPDVAVLDVNLGQENSMPVAEALTRLGVPFVFATGYGDGIAIPEAFINTVVVRKPYTAHQLGPAIMALLHQ